MKTIIIAEAGVNHNGDMNIAKQLIEAASLAGADIVKFQTFRADRLVTKESSKAAYQIKSTGIEESQYSMLQKLELSLEDHVMLIELCSKYNISFLSTAFDILSFDSLMNLGLSMAKIPSGELTNLPLLRHIARVGKPVILSTGMSTLGEIEAALIEMELAGTPRNMVTVLHCTTEYPAPMTDINLRAMVNIKIALGVEVGYSDHSLGIEIPIAAVALGARVIEKHFTIDRALPGPDHQASLEPYELKAMVNSIRNVEAGLGDGIKRPSPSELENRAIARKSLVAIRSIRSGDVFSAENVGAKRPGVGISPMRWDEVIGRTATKNFSVDDLISL
jgi:N,N'-diacetyllegionaminate synthase